MEPCVQLGDQVIIYQSRDSIVSLIVRAGQQLQCKFGVFKHEAMVGVLFGSKLASGNGRGFVYLLRPTPELWTLALPHRTQILYQPDISFITSFLDVKPGSKVIEAGTGSGSFSHSLARSVGTEGKVYSYEFHEERYTKALAEFEQHGLSEIIQLKHQNVYKDGFELVDTVDSVFLDLPAPWEAIGHAKAALRRDRQSRICCFSPCIEQVLKTVSALSELGFSDVTTYETLSRTHDPAVLIAPPISSAIERISAVESKRERRRDGQIEQARVLRESRKRQREAEEELAAALALEVLASGEGVVAIEVKVEEGEERPAKRIALEGDSKVVEESDVKMEDVVEGSTIASTSTLPAPVVAAAVPTIKKAAQQNSGTSTPRSRVPSPPLPPQFSGPKVFTFKASSQLRGHTSYLTFAVLLPISPPTPKAEAIIEAAEPVVI